MDDDDLAEELRRDDGGAEPEPEPAAAPRVRSDRDEPRIPAWAKIGAVFVLLGGGVALLLFGTSASDAFVYSKLVNEVMSEPDRYVGRELRVEGQLQEGLQMAVRFPRCVVPDTFRDDMPMDVVVQGQLQTDGTFLANQVIPRCPSKYEMRERQQNGEEMPHSAVPAGETS